MLKKIIIISILIISVFIYSSTHYIEIIYTGSLNGNLDGCNCKTNKKNGIVKRAEFLRNYRKDKDNLILLDSGDVLTPYKDVLLSNYVIKAFNMMNYDAVALGDQEFINGLDFFKKNVLTLPLINSNVTIKNDDTIALNRYKIIEKNNIQIGIFSGLDTNPFRFYNKEIIKHLLIENYYNSVKKYVSILKPKTDILILISHAGFDIDQIIPEKIPGIDIIISGHSQTKLEEPKQINNTIIVGPGKNGYLIGNLLLKLVKKNKQCKIDSFENKLIELQYKTSPDFVPVRKLINEYIDRLKNEF